MTVRHRCFGLVVESEIALHGLSPVTDTGAPVDVTVRRASLRAPGPDVPMLAHGLWRDGDRCGVAVDGVGRFEARAGREIMVDAHDGADPEAVQLYVLGTLMGAIHLQRGHLVLHGNAFRVDAGCAVVVGHSGAGKSTLAAEMERRGHEVLSDDVVPVDGRGHALPGYPRIKLWDDALARMGRTSAGLARVHEGHEKFELPLTRHAPDSLPVRAVYALEVHDGPLELLPVHGIESFDVLAEHTYRRELVHGPDLVGAHLRQCADLAGRAAVVRVLRPRQITVEATAAALLEDLARLAAADRDRLVRPGSDDDVAARTPSRLETA